MEPIAHVYVSQCGRVRWIMRIGSIPMCTRTLLPLVFFLLLLSAHGQWTGELRYTTADQEKEEIRMRVDARQRLVLDHLQNGVRWKQEIMPLAAIDPVAIEWNEQEERITMRCLQGKRQCMQREEFRKATIWRSSHGSIPAPVDDPRGERTISTLRSLATAAKDPLVEALPATP